MQGFLYIQSHARYFGCLFCVLSLGKLLSKLESDGTLSLEGTACWHGGDRRSPVSAFRNGVAVPARSPFLAKPPRVTCLLSLGVSENLASEMNTAEEVTEETASEGVQASRPGSFLGLGGAHPAMGCTVPADFWPC